MEPEDSQRSRCTCDRRSRKANLEKQGSSFSCGIMGRWLCGSVLTPCSYLLLQWPEGLLGVSDTLTPHTPHTMQCPGVPWRGVWTPLLLDTPSRCLEGRMGKGVPKMNTVLGFVQLPSGPWRPLRVLG